MRREKRKEEEEEDDDEDFSSCLSLLFSEKHFREHPGEKDGKRKN